MQGDWWLQGSQQTPREPGEDQQTSVGVSWSNRIPTSPNIVTLNVQPKANTEASSQRPQIATVDKIISQQRRRKPPFQQKYILRPLTMEQVKPSVGFSHYLERQVLEGATAPNSTFSTQEFLSSYSQHNDVNRHISSEDFRNLERRLERERERRSNDTTGHTNRLEAKGHHDESSPVEMSRRNYFRPTGRNNYFSRDTSLGNSRMNGSNPDNLVAMGTLAISPSPRGGGVSYSGGSSGSQKDCFNSRLRSPPPRTKAKSVASSSMSPMAPERTSKLAKYQDPVGGAPPCFTQRLAELSALECETIRYERTRKLKRQTKQAKQD
ncbi:uncharacterized protein LOC144445518 [Glandiceps talaboti]